MTKGNPAHFDLVKQKNQMNIRNLLRQESPKSIALLASQAALTYPTVASLLKELEKKGEVIQSKNLESCGGRPGIRYELNVNYQYGLVLYFDEFRLFGKVYNVYGQVIKDYVVAVSQELTIDAVVDFARSIAGDYPKLTVISIGIPGVVRDNDILALQKYPKLLGKQLALGLRDKLHTEVFIENDLNAICYAEVKECQCFSHIAYVEHCLGAGIVLHGEVYTGMYGYAGELEYLCKNTNEVEESLVRCILSLICVLNQPLVYLSGEEITEEVVTTITNRLSKLVPVDRLPQIQVTGDLDIKYIEGLLKRILQYWENKLD